MGATHQGLWLKSLERTGRSAPLGTPPPHPSSWCQALLASDSGSGPLASLTRAAGVFQIAKLRSELEMVSGNVRVMSEMLTELVPTQAEPADLELLQVSRHPSAPR